MLPTYIRSASVNFRNLPFAQAIKFPIFVQSARVRGKGKIVIDCDNISHGMIRLGYPIVGFYTAKPVIINNDGQIVFHGYTQLGSGCTICVSEGGKVELETDFAATANLKLWCSSSIYFGKHTLIGWDCTIMDTNAHKLYDIKASCFKCAKGAITIGDNNWFAANCKVLHSVVTPSNCVFAMDSVVTKSSVIKSNCIMGGAPAKVISEDVIRIPGKDSI